MTPTPPTSSLSSQAQLSRALIVLLSITAAASVAGLYYAQPLLSLIAEQLHVSVGLAGLLVTGSQIGYAIGLVFIVPLGDVVSAKKTLTGLLVLSSLVLIAVGTSQNFALLCVGLVFVGIAASPAMLAVPLAAHLAAPERRGQATGTVMSGLLLGILLARTVSGFIAELCGTWRAIFFFAAAVALILAVVLWRVVPETGPTTQASYGELLKSIGTLILSSALLRRRMLLGFLMMAGFSLLWTSISFLLAGDHGSPYHLNEATIGIFGLAGAVGALGAPLVGKIADQGKGAVVATVACVLVILGWVFLSAAWWSFSALLIGLVVFDLGVQMVHLSNQHAIYHTHADSRSRATSAYMFPYFLGGMTGSALSGFLYQSFSWGGVCAGGIFFAIVALGVRVWINVVEKMSADL